MKKNNQKLKCGYALVYSLMLAFFSLDADAVGTISTTDITLKGNAQGGVLSLSEVLPIGAGFASVVTTQGESAESALNKLADEVCRSSSFNWHRPLQPRPSYVKVAGNTLTLPFVRLKYAFSGSDKGFVTLKPVSSVSGSYDAEKHQVNLSWVNPQEQYDVIQVGSLTFPANTTNCSYACDPSEREHMSCAIVVGKRGDVFSALASITINKNSQEELDTFPFYMGLAPNWSCWSDNTNVNAVICEQGIKPDVDLSVRGDPWDKPLYQLVKTTKSGVQGGVWRRFLGLKPSHTYQVEVRMNTFKMDACTNKWEFSFHATADNPDGTLLTAEQMAGAAPLPDGTKGPSAGCVIAFGPGRSTKGQWKLSSINPLASSPKAKYFTLPKGVTSITVWFRHSGANSTGVGTDWIKLTDVTEKSK